MPQVPDMDMFNALANRVEAVEAESSFLKSLLLAERWLSRKQTMVAIGCSHQKLWELTKANTIHHNYRGKSPYYDVFSIRNYLTGLKLDSRDVDKRLLSARFAS